MDPRQILVVLNVSVMKCIFMEEKIWKCFYIRLYQYAFVQRISIVERKEYMENALGSWLFPMLL